MEVNIRPPLLLRVYTYAFGVFWCAGVVYGFVQALPKATAVVPALMLVFGVTLCWRLGGLSARSDGGTLVIRNIYRTRRIPAADITDLRTGTAPMQPLGRAVFVVTKSEAVALDASAMWSFRGRTDQSLTALQRWLRTQQP